MYSKVLRNLLLPKMTADDTLPMNKSNISFLNAREILDRRQASLPDSEKNEANYQRKVLLKSLFMVRESLDVPNQYHSVPGGVRVVFGRQNIQDDRYVGLVSALTTLALTIKYSLPTWHPVLIDYALDAVEHFSHEYANYDEAFNKAITNIFPTISIGTEIINFRATKMMEPTLTKSFKQVVADSLRHSGNLLMISRTYNCLILKRCVFYYVFSGFPTNNLGFRRFSEGYASILRCSDLDSLVRHVAFAVNPDGGPVMNFVIFCLQVTSKPNVELSETSLVVLAPNSEKSDPVEPQIEAKKITKKTIQKTLKEGQETLKENRETIDKIYNNARKIYGEHPPKLARRK